MNAGSKKDVKRQEDNKAARQDRMRSGCSQALDGAEAREWMHQLLTELGLDRPAWNPGSERITAHLAGQRDAAIRIAKSIRTLAPAAFRKMINENMEGLNTHE